MKAPTPLVSTTEESGFASSRWRVLPPGKGFKMGNKGGTLVVCNIWQPATYNRSVCSRRFTDGSHSGAHL